MKLRNLYNEVGTTDVDELIISDIATMLGLPTDGNPQIMVVTNRNSYLGATNIFLREAQDAIARELDVTEFIVIPSSKHEVLCVRPELAKSELVQMITQVNQTEVREEDRLDAVPYICNAVRHTLREM